MASVSDLLTSIGSTLEDFQFMADVGTFSSVSGFDWFTFMLRNLKIFLVSVKKLGAAAADDPSLGSFLQPLSSFVCGFAEWSHTVRLVVSGLAPTQQAEDFEEWDPAPSIKSMEEALPGFQEALCDASRKSNTTVLSGLETADMMATVLKNLSLFHCLDWNLNVEVVEEAVKALGGKMLFLENLRVFASSVKVADDGDLRAHLEAVSLQVAFSLFKLFNEHRNQGESFSEDFLSGISASIQSIKPIHPQICTHILRSSKLQRKSLAPADRDVEKEDTYAKALLDSLRSYLLEIIQLDDTHTPAMAPMKDQLEQLYDGLGSLIFHLSQNSFYLDLKTKDRIFDVVCDAGVLICSLYQTHSQLHHHDVEDLFEAIRLVLAEFGEEAKPEPKFNNVPTTAPLSFADFLLEKLEELTSSEVETDTKSYAQAIIEELVTLRSFLGDIVGLGEEGEEFQTVRDRILELVYRAENLIDYLVVGDLSDSFSVSFQSCIEDMRNIKMGLEAQKADIKMKGITMTHHSVQPSQRNLSFENEVVGYLDQAESIKNRLLRGSSKKLQIVPIVGMAGQGKTTLSAKIYSDHSISYHFSIRAHTVVSQTVEKRRVLLDLLGQIDHDKCSGDTSDINCLVQKVWQSLKGKRYLIFLDDIWGAGAWSSLKEAFPDDHTSSRIMFTSRYHDVAPNEEPHELRPFTEAESMDLLGRKLFGGSIWPNELFDLGREIAQICNGLPLTILIVAGILATMESEGWKKILSGLGSGIVSNTEQCRKTLELSYNHLPDHLRPCFLYMATFSEDEEVSVKRLLRLWIAEGFVRKDERKRDEDVAEGYLKDLFGRSLLMVAIQKSIGGVKSCRIHDLLHEFCLQKAKDEQFFYFLGESEKALEYTAPHYLRRLCIESDPKYFRKSNKIFPYLRSLNFNYYYMQGGVPQNLSLMFQVCKVLRVLDLEHFNIGRVFPSEIGLLLQLAFLAIGGCMDDIPPSIGNLSNLQTLILNQFLKDKTMSLPESVWNLQKLRYLHMTNRGGTFPMENLSNSSDLCELDCLSGVAIQYPCDLEGLLKKFPNIRKLKFTLLPSQYDEVHIFVPKFLSQLESLSMSIFSNGYRPCDFSLPENLKKLTLTNLELKSSNFSTISGLSNLEVLRLFNVGFEDLKWEMEEGFSKLRFLLLSSMELLSWTASDDHLECLEKLVLVNCNCLEEMPSCLEYIPTLEMIEARYCTDRVLELVGKIKKAQQENGNAELKIITVKSS